VVKRAELLLKLADVIEANLDELAELESRDQGKPVWLAKAVDIPRAVTNFRLFGRAVPHQLEKCVT
jgi:aminomuconate-semialdehyde/2-hydroxymuconate-6-semialdehyde dehydrogenase